MADNVLGVLFQDIANAIRAKTGGTDTMKPNEFPTQIANIPAGGGSSADVRYVTFIGADGAVLYKKAVAVGDDCVDVAAKGLISTPTKEMTVAEVYTFNGWSLTSGGAASSAALANVTEDRTVYAAFTASARKYTVRFINGDTVLQTQTVAYGGSAVYTGDEPQSADGSSMMFSGWLPDGTNIKADTDCYAQYVEAPTLVAASWAKISEISDAGTAENYFAIGDTKPVKLKGTIGTLDIDETYYVYIIGFNHNSELEGNGIHFGTFKSAQSDGIDLCLVDSNYNTYSRSDTKYFNLEHWTDMNYGGWAGCDMRYDVLGSTDNAPSGYGAAGTSGRTGSDPSSACATNPVANTLMAALPADLRAVMKPMTKYSSNAGNASNRTEAVVTATIDYLPLLAEYEVCGERKYANSYEQNKQAQYAYFAAGNSKIKYSHLSNDTAATWWTRSPHETDGGAFCYINTVGTSYHRGSHYSYGIAPIFKV